MHSLLADFSKAPVLALVYDETCPLDNVGGTHFPADATAEWESADTITKLKETWSSLGFDVQLCPLNRNFLAQWAARKQTFSLVHSVAEGWGTASREGWVASLCELSGVPYIGSSPLGLNIAMKKSLTKVIATSLGVPTAAHHVIRHQSDLAHVPENFLREPHFIKPDAEGSGMGIDATHSISSSPEKTFATVGTLLPLFPEGLVLEIYLPGREFTAAHLNSSLAALPIAEIEVDTGVYGIANKGKDAMNEKVSFPTLPAEIEATILEGTRKLASALEWHDFVRTDWKMDGSGKIFFLESNPLAGLSYFYSVLPKMAAHAGMSYGDLLAGLASSAIKRKNGRNLWYGRARL